MKRLKTGENWECGLEKSLEKVLEKVLEKNLEMIEIKNCCDIKTISKERRHIPLREGFV